MKNISNKIAAILAISFLCGCSDNELDRYPQDQISSATYWTTEKEALKVLNGCYKYKETGAYMFVGDPNYSNDGYSAAYNDGASDNANAQYPWESNATVVAAGDYTALGGFNGYFEGYKRRYTGIRQFNYFLDNIGKTPMDATLKKRFIAEVRVLRATTYAELARAYGAVVLIKNTYADPKDVAVTPTPEAEVIAFALSELSSAAADLPISYAGGLMNEKGRITTGAAWAYKARIELGYNKWIDAVASAQEVMKLGYQLFRVTSLTANDTKDDYSNFVTFANQAEKDKFYKGLASYEQQFWAVNENNKEIIMASQNINNSAYEYGNGLNTLLTPSALGGWSSITPTVELVNAYWDKNGNDFIPPTAAKRASDYKNGRNSLPYYPNAAYYNEFQNRDTRLYASILFPTSPWNRGATNYKFVWGKGGNNNSKTGYNFRKMVDPAYKNEWDGAQDFPIIRYAEILLSYAEAKNELSGPDTSIFTALNDIRNRSGMPDVDPLVYNTQVKLRQLIRNERRIELACEGQRFQDIRRWNIAATVMKTTNDITNDLAQTRQWDPKYVKLPYPQEAVDHNPNLGAAQSAKGY
jgi:hypothetical protein